MTKFLMDVLQVSHESFLCARPFRPPVPSLPCDFYGQRRARKGQQATCLKVFPHASFLVCFCNFPPRWHATPLQHPFGNDTARTASHGKSTSLFCIWFADFAVNQTKQAASQFIFLRFSPVGVEDHSATVSLGSFGAAQHFLADALRGGILQFGRRQITTELKFCPFECIISIWFEVWSVWKACSWCRWQILLHQDQRMEVYRNSSQGDPTWFADPTWIFIDHDFQVLQPRSTRTVFFRCRHAWCIVAVVRSHITTSIQLRQKREPASSLTGWWPSFAKSTWQECQKLRDDTVFWKTRVWGKTSCYKKVIWSG